MEVYIDEIKKDEIYQFKSKIKFLGKIENGSFVTVIHVLDKLNKKDVAIKIINKRETKIELILKMKDKVLIY